MQPMTPEAYALDVEVAESIFGFVRVTCDDYDGGAWADLMPPDNTLVGKNSWRIAAAGTPIDLPSSMIWVPRFSVDRNVAFRIVDEMERRSYWCQMRTPFMEPGGQDGYWCGFTPHGTSGWNGTPDHWTSAPTLAEAICRAALKCVQEREP